MDNSALVSREDAGTSIVLSDFFVRALVPAIKTEMSGASTNLYANRTTIPLDHDNAAKGVAETASCYTNFDMTHRQGIQRLCSASGPPRSSSVANGRQVLLQDEAVPGG